MGFCFYVVKIRWCAGMMGMVGQTTVGRHFLLHSIFFLNFHFITVKSTNLVLLKIWKHIFYMPLFLFYFCCFMRVKLLKDIKIKSLFNG